MRSSTHEGLGLVELGIFVRLLDVGLSIGKSEDGGDVVILRSHLAIFPGSTK